MNERKLSNFCLLLLVFSMLLRLICATGADARMAESVPAAQTEPDEPAAPAAQQLRVWPVRVIRDGNASEAEPWEQLPGTADRQPDDAERAPALTFSPEVADAITIAGACTYSVDKQALLTRPSALDFSGEGPKVLIVHTHSSEAYTQEAGWEYDESDPLRTENADRSIIRVGDEIASVLEAHGIETLHDTALNDYPTYNGAYARMETTIERYLAEYPSIRMVLDVHRDAAADADGEQVGFTAQVDGERCAQVMLVVGTDEGHPRRTALCRGTGGADRRAELGCILPTPNAPGERGFSHCTAAFSLEMRQDSCEKMSCAAQKSLAAGHFASFQIHPS